MATAAQRASVRRYIYGGSTRSGSLSTADLSSFIDEEPSVLFAAAAAAEAEAAASYANPTLKKVGDLVLDRSEDYRRFSALAAGLRRRASARIAPAAVSISESAKDTAYNDSDMVTPAFRSGQFDNPSSASTLEYR